MRKWLPEELMTVRCDLCGSNENSAEFSRADGMLVVECAKCGLAYLNPRPLSEFITKFYEKDYFTGASAERGEGGLTCDVHRVEQHSTCNEENLPRPIKIINARYGGLKCKDVLEVGCATGDLLSKIQCTGARAQGVELSEFAADLARKRNLDVTTGTIDDIAETRKQFDIVIAFEVIEHVLSPKKFLNNVSRVMRPGGLFLVSTPNYACAKRFGGKWYGFNASFEHIYFFSLVVLKAMMQDAGFTLDYWETSTMLGGPDHSSSFFRLQIERIRNLIFLIKELGVYRTIRALFKRQSGYYPYGVGHTLLAVFEKK